MAIVVAQAAPEMPMSSTKMNMGSRIMFNPAPSTIMYMARFEEPSDLSSPLKMSLRIITGNPRNMGIA